MRASERPHGRWGAPTAITRLVTGPRPPVGTRSWQSPGAAGAGDWSGPLASDELVHAEQVVVVGPYAARPPVGRVRQLPELIDRVFVGVLGVDGLARLEGKTLTSNRNILLRKADQVHF